MLRLAVTLLAIAMIAAFFGFTQVAGIAWDGFRIVALIFLVLAVLAFLGSGLRSPPV